jgi:hypothetical protein
MEWVFVAAGAVLAVAVRYMLAQSQACLIIGRSLSGTDTSTGLQDAITPPEAANRTLILWALTVAAFVAAFWVFGLDVGVTTVVVFFIALFVAGAVFVPKPQSAHWVGVVQRSLADRAAAYRKGGDLARATAVEDLLGMLREHQSRMITTV